MPSVEVTPRAQCADEIVGTGVTHDPDALDRQQHGEGLPHRAIETGVADFLEKDRIGLAQDIELGARDLARDADRQPWAPDEPLGYPQLAVMFTWSTNRSP
jgi:hypothetical protein